MIVTEVDLSYSIKLIAHCADSQYRSLYDLSGFGHRNLATSCRKSDPLRHNTDCAVLGGGAHTHKHAGAAGTHTVKTGGGGGGGGGKILIMKSQEKSSNHCSHVTVSRGLGNFKKGKLLNHKGRIFLFYFFKTKVTEFLAVVAKYAKLF